MVYVLRLLWTDWNKAHIARHGVTPTDIENVCHGPHVTSQTYKGRLRVIGQTPQGTMLTVMLSPKGEGVYYTVTAYPSSEKEIKRYIALGGGEDDEQSTE